MALFSSGPPIYRPLRILLVYSSEMLKRAKTVPTQLENRFQDTFRGSFIE
jgi:hypothetical protein